ncbi:MAG: hypothetical protein DRP85_03285 [Candidatus Makaraimicrobium thalassicum]|nr:MAG: hypothetical protein DRP85_03285 [Candidatus Omnitrophota bacterium]
MTEVITVDNIGLKGINTDVAAWSLPPEFITRGDNFRIYAGSIFASGGYAEWSTAPELFFPGYLMHTGSLSGDYWVVLGRTKVYSFDGQTWTDISSVEGYTNLGEDDELLWTGCELANIPIFNNPRSYPEYWNPKSPGQVLQALNFDSGQTWETKAISCEVMRSHKNFLIALGIHEGGIDYPHVVRISTAADINGLPYTWDETDKSGLAVRFQIGGDSGKIIDGKTLRDSFVIYSESGIDMITFVGGEFLWKLTELSSTVGVLSKNSIVEVKGLHYFISDGDILVNNGTTIKSIMHGRIKRSFATRINPARYHTSYSVINNRLKEIWFCVPTDLALYPNRAYIYNWTDDSWSTRKLPYDYDTGTEVLIDATSFIAYGVQTEPQRPWDSWEGTWTSQLGIWKGNNISPLDYTLAGVMRDSSRIRLMDPVDKADSPYEPAIIERTSFPLEGHRNVTTISRVYPLMVGTTPVEISMGSQDYPGAPVRWKTPVVFLPGKDRKIDVRTTGELHCWRIASINEYKDESIDSGVGNWSISGMVIEYSLDGAR